MMKSQKDYNAENGCSKITTSLFGLFYVNAI